ncbi:ThiF family adenylyltransferase [Candidatus Neomarinimicrobiota bacterium]
MTAAPRAFEKSLDWYNRYARHITLEEVGEGGQEALNQARVLLIGAGGLGSPIALYLTAAGIGTLGLVDFDEVSLNNLQRQILHGTSDVGRLKVDSAIETLIEINPHVNIVPFTERVTPDNIWNLVSAYDIVVDGSDNFATRFLVNDVCVQAKKPLVFAAVLQYSGQVTLFTQESDCGCYRCLFPEAPDPQYATTCVEAGILGVTTGIIGGLQANETVKMVLNSNGYYVGPTLKNKLLLYDGKDTTFRTIKLTRDSNCPVCSNPSFDFRNVTYAETCAVHQSPIEVPR